MTPPSRTRLHQLVAQLRDDRIEPAERYLASLCDQDDDPVEYAMRYAPIDDEEVTDEDRKDIEEGHRDIAAGRITPDHEIRRKLGL
jgi:predicted transcriptional regulator